MPLAGLLLGAAAPPLADVARPTLEAAVLFLVFACVTAAEFAVPNRVEVRSALMMIVATSIACPVAAGVLASVAGLPDDLSVAAVLAAASPVAIGAGVICHSFGLRERPAVWAALGGLVLGPALLPVVTIVAVPGSLALPVAVQTFAERVALLGALPACAAFLFRRAAPRVATAITPDLRGAAVIGLCVLALCAGGAAAETIRHAVPDEGSALLVIILAAFGASSAVWVTQRLMPAVPDRALSREMLVVSGARNISLVWASALGALTPRGHAVLAVAVAGTFVLPAAVPTFLIAISRIAAWTRTRSTGDLPASSPGLRWPGGVGALTACLALLTVPGNSQDRIVPLPPTLSTGSAAGPRTEATAPSAGTPAATPAAAVTELPASSDALQSQIADLQRQASELLQRNAQRSRELDHHARDAEQSSHDLGAARAENRQAAARHRDAGPAARRGRSAARAARGDA